MVKQARLTFLVILALVMVMPFSSGCYSGSKKGFMEPRVMHNWRINRQISKDEAKYRELEAKMSPSPATRVSKIREEASTLRKDLVNSQE